MAVGGAMAGKDVSYTETPWFWSVSTASTLLVAGSPADGVQAVVRPGPATSRPASTWDVAGRLVGAVGFDSPREVRGTPPNDPRECGA